MTRLSRWFCLLSLVPSALAAQTNAERILNDHYTRSHDYDLLHQRIEVRDFDWDSLSFTGRVSTTLRALRPGFDSLILDAGALLQVRAVSLTPAAGVPGKPARATQSLRYEHRGDTLVVYLRRSVGFGDTVRLTIDYRGRVTNGRGLTFIEADTAPPRRPRQVWSQGEDHDNHYWFPTYDFPNDKTTWELLATVPGGFTAVSNGSLLLDRRNADGTRTFHWSQDQRSATYLVSLVVAPLARVRDRWRGIPVDYYVYPEDSALARPLFHLTPDMMEVYSRLTGLPYPWRKYAQTTVADFFGGMENVSATTLVDWLPDRRAYADRPWYQHILIPHELAHQWFGDYVTTANWANMWLNEGFAEFLPGQYWSTRLGRHAADDYYLDEYLQFMRIDRTRRMPLAALGSNNIYPKGALVLEMLRKYLGPERFWAGLGRYLGDHALDVAISDDVRRAFLEATGENLDWFWDQWIYEAGFPEFTVAASWDSSSATVTLVVQQTQVDTLPADSTGLRFTVPTVFRMPVTVKVGSGRGDVTALAQLTERQQEIRIPEVSASPTMVIFDDGNTILKTLTFPQPTEWLATQLERDPDLWNRWWVIGQLRVRKTDPLAEQALVRAATAADYFLTRAQAADGLRDFTSEPARAALLRALGDSSAQVRAAAAAALAQSGGDQVLAAIRMAWERDSSYEVRAAALETLGRLDSTHVRELIREGLRTPSYQDVISDAALSLVAQTNDTTMLDEVAAEVGRNSNAVFLLAAFVARGNGRALELLTRQLSSSRATVRRKVLQAFELVIPPAIARSTLTTLRDTTNDPRLRSDIESTLGRIRS
jgi:aminopeptidase N